MPTKPVLRSFLSPFAPDRCEKTPTLDTLYRGRSTSSLSTKFAILHITTDEHPCTTPGFHARSLSIDAASGSFQRRLARTARREVKRGLHACLVVILILLGLLIVRANLKEAGGGPARMSANIIFDVRCCLISPFRSANRLTIYQQAKLLDRGSWEQQLKFVVLAGELAGPEAANKAAIWWKS